MDYTNLAKYLSNPDCYVHDYVVAKENKVHDYSVIVLWKIFILFSYEKIQQVRRIIGDDAFDTQYWNKGSLTKSPEASDNHKNALANFEIENVYTYSACDDDQIIDLISRIFGLEKNYSQLLKNIKNDRNTAAHVASDILKSQETTVLKTLNDLIRVTEHIDQTYKTKFLTTDNLENTTGIVNTESDLNYLIDNKIAESIQQSASFDESQKIYQLLSKKKHLLSCASIKKILEAMINGTTKGNMNQALDLGYAYNFLAELLKETYSKDCDLGFWKDFYVALDQWNQERLYDLRKSLQNHGANFDFSELNYIHPDDIPF